MTSLAARSSLSTIGRPHFDRALRPVTGGAITPPAAPRARLIGRAVIAVPCNAGRAGSFRHFQASHQCDRRSSRGAHGGSDATRRTGVCDRRRRCSPRLKSAVTARGLPVSRVCNSSFGLDRYWPKEHGALRPHLGSPNRVLLAQGAGNGHIVGRDPGSAAAKRPLC
jgi:hypothetical protein